MVTGQHRPQRGHGVASLVAAVALGAILLAGAAPTAAFGPSIGPVEAGLPKALDILHNVIGARDVGQRAARPRPGLPIDLGRDGRLTMLLMGSDWRRDFDGERIDTLMVATIDPTTKRAALLSVPRDMDQIPLDKGGTSGVTRVNSIYHIRYRDPSLGHRRIDRTGLRRFTRDMERFLGAEIDYWALLRFGDFAGLINKLGGIRVDIDEAVLDSSYRQRSSRGVWFPDAKDYRLKGDPQCRPRPRKCRSALAYARSRKGTMGTRPNTDYRRAERQQTIVLEGVRRALESHGPGLPLLGLLHGAREHLMTDVPMTPHAAAQLYAIVSGVKLARSDMKVLAPPTWGTETPSFAVHPNIGAIRRWVDRAFYRVRDRSRD